MIEAKRADIVRFIFKNMRKPTQRGSLSRLGEASLGREVYGGFHFLNRRGGAPSGAAEFIIIPNS